MKSDIPNPKTSYDIGSVTAVDLPRSNDRLQPKAAT